MVTWSRRKHSDLIRECSVSVFAGQKLWVSVDDRRNNKRNGCSLKWKHSSISVASVLVVQCVYLVVFYLQVDEWRPGRDGGSSWPTTVYITLNTPLWVSLLNSAPALCVTVISRVSSSSSVDVFRIKSREESFLWKTSVLGKWRTLRSR